MASPGVVRRSRCRLDGRDTRRADDRPPLLRREGFARGEAIAMRRRAPRTRRSPPKRSRPSDVAAALLPEPPPGTGALQAGASAQAKPGAVAVAPPEPGRAHAPRRRAL